MQVTVIIGAGVVLRPPAAVVLRSTCAHDVGGSYLKVLGVLGDGVNRELCWHPQNPIAEIHVCGHLPTVRQLFCVNIGRNTRIHRDIGLFFAKILG